MCLPLQLELEQESAEALADTQDAKEVINMYSDDLFNLYVDGFDPFDEVNDERDRESFDDYVASLCQNLDPDDSTSQADPVPDTCSDVVKSTANFTQAFVHVLTRTISKENCLNDLLNSACDNKAADIWAET